MSPNTRTLGDHIKFDLPALPGILLIKPLINGYPHCGDNSLLQRVADPKSDWRLWQKHKNAAVTTQVEKVTVAVGQVASTVSPAFNAKYLQVSK